MPRLHPRSTPRSQIVALRFVLVIAAAAAPGCEPTPLPEHGSAAATLYGERCGACHRAYHPAMLKPKMWETMVTRMEVEMKRRGIGLSADERTEILDYLSRNAGKL